MCTDKGSGEERQQSCNQPEVRAVEVIREHWPKCMSTVLTVEYHYAECVV